MPINRKEFSIIQDDLVENIDVDASDGRSVPINMNFVDTGFLTKDTGFSLYGDSESTLCHSLFHYKKKNGTSYSLRAKGTKLQSYNHKRVFTAANATNVFTSAGHGLANTTQVYVSSTLTLPTGLNANTIYYVVAAATDTFQLSATSGGAAIDITTDGTGVLYVWRVTPVWEDLSPTFTSGAEFGYVVYNDELWFGNAVESHQKWDGTTFTAYATAPKGNIYEIFEDRLFISGVIAEPLTVYYSNVGVPETFGATALVKPLGTDSVKALKNYYGTLMIFKAESIWKLTFVYDQVALAFLPKIESQTGNYGACSRKAVSWVENDLWFCTGTEVRSIGYQDNVTGAFGVNNSVISENIKETLKTLDSSDFNKVVTFYNNRRYYLGVPITASTVDTLFVCHLLYKRAWTKYADRIKSKVNDFMLIDDAIYTSSPSSPFGVIKWDETLNEVSIETIHKETFDTDPVARGWLYGTDWVYDSVNGRMKKV